MLRPVAAILVALFASACSSSNDSNTTGSGGTSSSTSTATSTAHGGGGNGPGTGGSAGSGGTGGSAGQGGSGGSGGAGHVLPPMPLISRGVPAFASSGNASDANDADYETMWRSSETTSTATPSWLAYDLSGVAKTKRGMVDVVWYSAVGGYSEYDLAAKAGAISYNQPRDYTIEGNAAAGGASKAPTTGWTVLKTVTGNTFVSRQAAVDLTGYNWVRIHVTKVNGTDQNYNTSIDLDVHDTSKGLEDSWLFLGDSITAFAARNDGAGIGAPSFAALINTAKPAYYPVGEGAGEGGWNSGDPLSTPSPDGNGSIFDYWIRNFPGHFVCLSYGTNDGANAGNGGMDTFTSLKKMTDGIIAAGKIPSIPHVPWAEDADHQTSAQIINGKIDMLYAMYPTMLKGPDLYGILNGHTEWFQDNLHPNPQGREVYRKSWADAMLPLVYP